MARMNNPLISVLIPSYNHVRYIEEAVRSVWGQTYRLLELVVADDCSTDGSRDLLLRLQANSPIPMKLELADANRGINANMSAALSASEGEYIALLDSDDLYLPGRFEEQASALDAKPDVMVAYGNGRNVKQGQLLNRIVSPDEVSRIQNSAPASYLKDLYTRPNTLFWQGFLIRRGFLIKCGGFEKDPAIAGDWSLNIRVFQQLTQCGYGFEYIDDDLFHHRIHEKNATDRFHIQTEIMLNVLRKYTPEELKPEAFQRIYWDRSITALWDRETRPYSFDLFKKSMKIRFSPVLARKYATRYLTAVKRDFIGK